jgi:hypothetical protein
MSNFFVGCPVLDGLDDVLHGPMLPTGRSV